MMSNSNKTIRPILARYEVEIPEESANDGVYYDDDEMVLMRNGIPLATSGDPYHSRGTKITFVGQETRDDN